VKVAVVSIAKNEEKFVARWAESCKDADYRVILDTGSDDKTVEIAKSLGVEIHEELIVPWHFANARNTLLDLLPDDIDWIINLDLDEVLHPGWREELEKVPNDGSVNRPRYLYTWNWEDYVHDENGEVDVYGTLLSGKPGLQYQGDKITRRFTHRWVNAVHEVNVTQPGYSELQGSCGLRISHFADNSKSRSSYLPLLLMDVEDNPDNDRNVYYAARELMFYGRTEESVAMFKRHLSMPSATWAPERAFSMRYIAKQQPHERETWLLRGCAEYPTGRELWVDLAKHYYDIGHWEGCFYAATRALEITNRGDLYLTEAINWGYLPHDLLAIAAYRLGRHDIAFVQGLLAVAHAPSDERLLENLFHYKNATSKVNAIIPTRDNYEGLDRLLEQLQSSSKISKIIVICDGIEAYERLDVTNNPKIIKIATTWPFNIHRAWNIGIDLSETGAHLFFVNDDVSLEDGCVDVLAAKLDRHDEIGLICPQYAPTEADREVVDTCRGKYDGSGGMAGFAMMLTRDLTKYRFPEELVLWYGDDHLVDHVLERGRKCVITTATSCEHENSKTIDKLPRLPLRTTVQSDSETYERIKVRPKEQ